MGVAFFSTEGIDGRVKGGSDGGEAGGEGFLRLINAGENFRKKRGKSRRKKLADILRLHNFVSQHMYIYHEKKKKMKIWMLFIWLH